MIIGNVPRKKKAPEPEPLPSPPTPPRLFQEVFPGIRSLNVEVTQMDSCQVFSESSSIEARVPCRNRLCRDGGIEPYASVEAAVQAHETAHAETVECPGSVGDARCARPFSIRVQIVYGPPKRS